MNSTVLLRKLLAIEQAIGTANNSTVRNMLHDAQNCLLQMQKETADGFLAVAWREANLGRDWFRKVS